MRLRYRFVLVSLLGLFASASRASTITGTVKGPDGAAFQGAFVEAQNAKTKITVAVLSDTQGHYRIEDLPGGAIPAIYTSGRLPKRSPHGCEPRRGAERIV